MLQRDNLSSEARCSISSMTNIVDFSAPLHSQSDLYVRIFPKGLSSGLISSSYVSVREGRWEERRERAARLRQKRDILSS